MANLQNLQINGTSFIDIVYPIGSIYETLDESFNPNTSFGGNWERIQGRFLLGAGTPDDNTHSNFGNNLTYNGTDKYDEPVGNMGGSSLHTLTVNEMPSHNHTLANNVVDGSAMDGSSNRFVLCIGGGVNLSGYHMINLQGGGASHNNLPPYFVIHIWKRTA